MSIEALSGKVFMLVTGASRGIGRQIAQSFASHLNEGSHVLLMATNLNALKETAEKIPKHLSVDCVSVDLSKAEKDELQKIIVKSLNGKQPSTFDRVVLIHNVGTMGDVSKRTNELTDVNVWRRFYDLNLFLPIVLNGVVMTLFGSPTIKKLVVNITSLLAIQPEKCLGYYCSVKAAREMFFKVYALENPDVNVLSYSPGPVYTDMFNYIRNDAGDPDVRQTFDNMEKNNTVLTAEQTVLRLLQVVKERNYKSGDRVDYYDKI